MVLQKIKRAYSLLKNGKGKNCFYSQTGEDCIINFVLNALNMDMKEVRYLDLGANDPVLLSNTYYFYKKGAKGVLVEANPVLSEKIEQKRSRDIVLNKAVALSLSDSHIDFFLLNVNTLSTASEEEALNTCKVDENIKIVDKIKVPAIRFDDIIEHYFSGIAPTFVSLDIEGLDYQILSTFDFVKYRPVLFVVETVEYHPKLSVPVKDKKILDLFEKNGYVEFAFTGINSIFVDRGVLNQL